MAKKRKKKVQPMPKLGRKDLCLYSFIMILCFLGAFLSVFFPIHYRIKLTQSNENVIAYTHGDGALNFMWLTILLFIVGIVVYIELYAQRIPVFGRPDIRYGAPTYPSIYPLLMKNKPQYRKSPKAVAQQRRMIVIPSVILIACLIFAVAIYPSSFYGRYELHQNGIVMVFDSKNQNVLQYSNEEIDTVCLDTNRTNTRRYGVGGRWYVSLKFNFKDGEKCSFPVESFGEDWLTAIQTAETLKACYGSLLHIEGTENLHKVVRDENMSADEEELLNALFEVNK